MLAIHPVTQKNLERIAHNLPQSLLLSGEVGVGLFTVGCSLANKNKAGEIFPQDAKGRRDNEAGTISVETIRQLYEQTRTKFTNRQIFIIDNADRMSHGAQNAFLKLLEEPNAHVHFILTSHQPEKLLSTIRSRLQQIVIQPISAEQSAAFIGSLNISSAIKKTQLQFLAAGLPAELTRLANDDEIFSNRAEIFSDARDFLQGGTYQKLLIIQKYRGDRSAVLRLIDSAMHILRRSVSANPQPTFISQLNRLLDAKERVSANQNIALQLARLVV